VIEDVFNVSKNIFNHTPSQNILNWTRANVSTPLGVNDWGLSKRRTSDLLFECRDEEDGLLQNPELRLRLVRLKSHRNHPTELFERLVYVADSHPVHRRKTVVTVYFHHRTTTLSPGNIAVCNCACCSYSPAINLPTKFDYLKSLSPLITKIWNAIQNAENMVVLVVMVIQAFSRSVK